MKYLLFCLLISIVTSAQAKQEKEIDCDLLGGDERELLRSYFLSEIYIPAMAKGKKINVKKVYDKVQPFMRKYQEGLLSLEDSCTRGYNFDCKVYHHEKAFNQRLEKTCQQMKAYKKSKNYIDPDVDIKSLVYLQITNEHFSPTFILSFTDWIRVKTNPAFEIMVTSDGVASSQQEVDAASICFKALEAIMIAKSTAVLQAHGINGIEGIMGNADEKIQHILQQEDYFDYQRLLKNLKEIEKDMSRSIRIIREELGYSMKHAPKLCSEIQMKPVEEVRKKLCSKHPESLSCRGIKQK